MHALSFVSLKVSANCDVVSDVILLFKYLFNILFAAGENPSRIHDLVTV